MAQWEVFPRRRWPRGFGLRERHQPRSPIDGDQLELDPLVTAPPAASPSPRDNLRRVLELSQLPQREFATWVLGCADFTLTRYLRGERIPENRANFLRRLESVTVHGDVLLITLRVGHVRRVPWWRRRS